MDEVYSDVLEKVADIRDFPDGAYNIRADGESIGRKSTRNIGIESKKDVSGMDIYIAAGTVGETVHIPVVISQSGLNEVVYNDFHVGENADVTIIAGCGIHNCGSGRSQHDGVHSFYLEKGAKVRYVEKHYGSGDGTGERVLNPVTNVYLKEGSALEMDTVQIEGVDSTKRYTYADIADGASLVIKEKLMTHDKQVATTDYEVNLNGKKSRTNVISRSVAKDDSEQIFLAKINGNEDCMGHSECDAIIMGNASVRAIPEITANHVEASLIHEAAIGKIAGEQIVKLMTLGLSEQEAEQKIIEGFLN